MLSLPDFLPAVKPGLYLVATPIGNRGDITLRALDVLQRVDLIYCEDTRTSKPLLDTFGIKTPLKALHDHNEDKMIPDVMTRIQAGQAVALISDAGMPLISDPGFVIVRALQDNNLPVTVIPGASAVITAAALSGIPTDKFMFLGFMNPKDTVVYKDVDATLILYESPHRLLKSLEQLAIIFSNRQVAVTRELTKLHEEVVRGAWADVIANFTARDKIRGEFVLVLSPPTQTEHLSEADLDQAILDALKSHTLKDACTLVAGALGLPRKDVYKRALILK